MNHEEAARLMGAYLDGELDLATCVKLEEHLAGCEACQQKMEGESEFIETIRTEAPRHEATAFLKTRVQAHLREAMGERAGAVVTGLSAARGSRWRIVWPAWMFSGLAAAAAVMLAFFSPWAAQSPLLVQEAVADHVRSLQVNHLMDVASTDQHTVKPWFAGKIDFSPQIIDLTASGYPLIGGRLDVLDRKTVAAVIYGRRKHYINLFVWPEDARQKVTSAYAQDGYHVLGWKKAGMNYVAVSEIGEQELRDFEKLIQDQTVENRPGE